MYAALLSGKNIRMAKAEISSVTPGFKEHRLDGRVIVFGASKTPDFQNLGLTHEAGVFLGNSIEEVDFSCFAANRMQVSSVNLGHEKTSLSLKKKIGEIITKNGLKVDFKSRDVLMVYITDNAAYFTKQVFVQDKKDFAKRAPPKRKFFMPTSIDPMFARALANLGGARKGARILDPFCGSGGLLLEAAAVGAEVYGCDIEDKCVKGTIENLKQFGFKVTAVTRDALEAGEAFKKKFDGVVTDLPFGKSTKLLKEKKKLYSGFLHYVPGIIEHGGRAVVGCDEETLDYPENDLLLEHKFSVYIHKSMTRHFFVFSKNG